MIYVTAAGLHSGFGEGGGRAEEETKGISRDTLLSQSFLSSFVLILITFAYLGTNETS